MLLKQKAMRIFSILFITCLFIVFQTASLQAQGIKDFETRTSLFLKYKPIKSLTFTGKYYLYLNDNSAHYKKSAFGGKVKYKPVYWFRPSFQYLYQATRLDPYHDLRYAIDFKWKISKKFQVIYQPVIQQMVDTKQRSEFVWRNRLTLNYRVNKKLDLFVFTKAYLEMGDGLHYYKQKSAIGASYDLTKRSELELRFAIKNKEGKNDKPWKHKARVSLNYTYTIKPPKKKKPVEVQ